MKHFDKTVNEKTALKLKELADLVKDNYISDQNNAMRGGEINEISGVSYSGFIPFQKGGYSVDEFYSHAFSSGESLTNKEQEFADKTSAECWKDFLSDNGLKESTEYDDLTNEQQNDLSGYEIESLEPTLLRYESWVDDDDRIFLRLSAGYEDAPYYRTQYDETIKELTLEEKDFLEKDLETLAKSIFKPLTK